LPILVPASAHDRRRQVASMQQLDAEASRRVEATYTTPDVVEQRQAVLGRWGWVQASASSTSATACSRWSKPCWPPMASPTGRSQPRSASGPMRSPPGGADSPASGSRACLGVGLQVRSG
jgi:hypothetical protein